MLKNQGQSFEKKIKLLSANLSGQQYLRKSTSEVRLEIT